MTTLLKALLGLSLLLTVATVSAAALTPDGTHHITVTGDVCEEDEVIVGFGDYKADIGYQTYRCFTADDLPVDAWPL